MHRQKGDNSKGEGDDEAEEENGRRRREQPGHGVGERAVKDIDDHPGVQRIVDGSGAPRQPTLVKAPLAAKGGLEPRGVAAVNRQSTGQLGANEAHGQRENHGDHEERDENVEWTPPSHSVFEPYRPATHVEKSDDSQAPNAELPGVIPAQQKRGLVSRGSVAFELKLVVGTVPAAHEEARVMAEK